MHTLTTSNLPEFRRLWQNKFYRDMTFGQALATFLSVKGDPPDPVLEEVKKFSYPQAEAWISSNLPPSGQ